MTRRRIIAKVAAGVSLVLGAYLFLAAWSLAIALWINFDEMMIPPASEAPDGLIIESDEMGCGSGGGWRGLMVQPPKGQPAQQLAAALGLELEHETCEARNLLDRRRVCIWGNAAGDDVHLSLYYDQSLRLWPFR